MYLALGVSLLSAAAILFAWAYAAHRRPVPARWTGREFLSSGICIIITALLPIGGGYLTAAALDPVAAARSLGPGSLGLIVVSVALLWILWPRIMKSVPAKLSSAGATPPPRPPKQRPSPGTRHPASSERAGKRAA